jgi:hypothetical protein
MTATVTSINRGGRPSNELRELRDRAADLSDELRAVAAERLDVATQTVALARRARMVLDARQSPRELLSEIERLGLREHARAKAAA